MDPSPLPYPVRYRQRSWTVEDDWEYAAAMSIAELDEGDDELGNVVNLHDFYGSTFCPATVADPLVEAFIGNEWIRVLGRFL